MRYPGYIMRQSLVDESQKRVEELKEQEHKTYTLMETNGLDQKSKQALAEQHSMILGQIKAMRDINEWVKEQSIPPNA
jgi:hypothetical protein